MFRELTAHVLELMAPYADVMRPPWFKQDETFEGPRRRQRAQYTWRREWDSLPLRRDCAKTRGKQGFPKNLARFCDHRCVPLILVAGSSISAAFEAFGNGRYCGGAPKDSAVIA
ncbi:hypothetical protein I6F30_11505 [Bradyrhizobium sp. NBAIM20]|nr:hypothetical protein [Bradyrhizobium sp. NBAIM20]MCA1460902.1 hypothetical protein [Bradyrhizobium sp. NBAIM18]